LARFLIGTSLLLGHDVVCLTVGKYPDSGIKRAGNAHLNQTFRKIMLGGPILSPNSLGIFGRRVLG
jgi:hypothetical protein